LPDSVELVEVGPRDGLQSEQLVLATDAKAELIRRVVGSGARRVEAVSFAHPARVPQMADAEAVLALLGPAPPGVSYIGLVMNRRGWERAAATAVDEVNLVVAASDGYSLSNQGATTADAMAEVEALLALARAAGRRAGVTIAVAFGDPVDGEVPAARVAELAARAVDAGATEVALGDTIGVAVPPAVVAVIGAVQREVPEVTLRCHFHDTRRSGLANVYAAIGCGVTVFDTSVGGIGGSPFAPEAGGNVATEDAVAFLERMGIATGRDLFATIAIGAWLAEHLGHGLPAAHQHVAPWPG
jgi:hydroxymethylglutaryl-CoA lyase